MPSSAPPIFAGHVNPFLGAFSSIPFLGLIAEAHFPINRGGTDYGIPWKVLIPLASLGPPVSTSSGCFPWYTIVRNPPLLMGEWALSKYPRKGGEENAHGNGVG